MLVGRVVVGRRFLKCIFIYILLNYENIIYILKISLNNFKILYILREKVVKFF